MQKFKAYRTFQENDAVKSRFVELTLDDLDPGDVVVRTKYSTINYKDALSYNGAGKICGYDERGHRHGRYRRIFRRRAGRRATRSSSTPMTLA